MSGKSRKTTDRIYVKGGGGPQKAPSRKNASQDDITLLALQLACPQRWEPGENQVFENIHEICNLMAITIETRLFSSLVLVGAGSTRQNVKNVVAGLTTQLQNIIKSAQEKIYFIESFPLVDPSQANWDFFVKMSDYCFMQQTGNGEAFISYFRLEKTNDDERFATKAVENMVDGEVAEQDVYLFFQRNNRYIKILKKGEAVQKNRMERLQSRGVKDLYVSADQGIEVQQRRVRHIILELLEDYATMIDAA